MRSTVAGFALFLVALLGAPGVTAQDAPRRTAVAIAGDAFHINGKPTYPGRTWQGHKVEGLLFNSRMVQATFDDASWGYFDYRMQSEGFDDGYQSVPANWGISSPRKKAFFDRLREITGEG